jgi:hypothetical protein
MGGKTMTTPPKTLSVQPNYRDMSYQNSSFFQKKPGGDAEVKDASMALYTRLESYSSKENHLCSRDTMSRRIESKYESNPHPPVLKERANQHNYESIEGLRRNEKSVESFYGLKNKEKMDQASARNDGFSHSSVKKEICKRYTPGDIAAIPVSNNAWRAPK